MHHSVGGGGLQAREVEEGFSQPSQSYKPITKDAIKAHYYSQAAKSVQEAGDISLWLAAKAFFLVYPDLDHDKVEPNLSAEVLFRVRVKAKVSMQKNEASTDLLLVPSLLKIYKLYHSSLSIIFLTFHCIIIFFCLILFSCIPLPCPLLVYLSF